MTTRQRSCSPGVGWHTAHQAVSDYTDPAISDPARLEGVRGIGIDEKRGWWFVSRLLSVSFMLVVLW